MPVPRVLVRTSGPRLFGRVFVVRALVGGKFADVHNLRRRENLMHQIQLIVLF